MREAAREFSEQTLAVPQQITTKVKLIYGSGDWSLASFGTLRQIFYAIFLTDVVGLDPRIASFAALIGIIWDAINDPLVGMLSDRVSTRWGRRRPFFLLFALPFGLGFLFLWWAPPWHSPWLVAATVTLAFILSDTFQTLVSIPYYALTPEIAPDYDDRTSLTTYRMFFNLLASLTTAITAPQILDVALQHGLTQQQGYLIVAALFGGLAVIPFLLIFAFIPEPPHQEASQRARGIPLKDTIRSAWENIPFRFAVALYILNWVTFDLVALMLPFFLVYWIAQGNLIAQASIFGVKLALESAVLGILLVVAVIALPLWNAIAHRLGKRKAYILGMSFWAVVQLMLYSLKPGEVQTVLWMAALAGLSVSTAHVLPDAIFPDVIEWDELRTRQRREGIYYGIKNFLRKLTGAGAIFGALQVLGWFGYQSPPEGVTQFTQSPRALSAIRVLTGPAGSVILLSAILVAWFYPLTRERHARIRRLLARRQSRILQSPPYKMPETGSHRAAGD